MADATGETDKPVRVAFDRRIKLQFHGAQITSDGGLLAYRELDDAFGLTAMGASALGEGRRGRNIRHHLPGLLRQAVYGRPAGYEPPRFEDVETTVGALVTAASIVARKVGLPEVEGRGPASTVAACYGLCYGLGCSRRQMALERAVAPALRSAIVSAAVPSWPASGLAMERSMHSLLHSLDRSTLLAREGPVLVLALVIAELFYKFGSFSLECLAFLATWYVLGRIAHAIWGRRAAGDGQ
jgi:hypothetical protein